LDEMRKGKFWVEVTFVYSFFLALIIPPRRPAAVTAGGRPGSWNPSGEAALRRIPSGEAALRRIPSGEAALRRIPSGEAALKRIRTRCVR
jgi:hypothetical protein